MKQSLTMLEIHKQKPQGFLAQVEVAACYLEIDRHFLLLQKVDGKSEGGKWGVPAGKLEKDETPQQAAERELFEETGITPEQISQIQYLNALYIRKPGVDYVYHLFKVSLDQISKVHLSDEHRDYKWATVEEMQDMPLMEGAYQALEHYRDLKED